MSHTPTLSSLGVDESELDEEHPIAVDTVAWLTLLTGPTSAHAACRYETLVSRSVEMDPGKAVTRDLGVEVMTAADSSSLVLAALRPRVTVMFL